MTSILKQMEDDLNFIANGMADELWRLRTNKVTTTFVDSRQTQPPHPHFCFFEKNVYKNLPPQII